MNTKDIQAASRAGSSDWEVLHMVIAAGVEYPDAVWKVSQALRMDEEQRETMARNYDECA